ncbi:Uma2 family endonuclease [Spirosoma profusum]|nr:Uma2 family endonuclease [Spirosoma profusum]
MALDLDQLLDAPNLKLLMQQTEVALRDEARQRQQFYDWVNEDHKAEFINGAIVMHSPVKERHWVAVGNLYTLLRAYAIKHKLGRVASEKAMVSLTRNDYEPDICFWNSERSAAFESETMQFPASDLAVEVLSRSTEKIDRGIKYDDYAAHGVQEYWIVDTRKQLVEQYKLDTDFQTFALENTGKIGQEIASDVVKGFRISVASIFDESLCNEALISILNH